MPILRRASAVLVVAMALVGGACTTAPLRASAGAAPPPARIPPGGNEHPHLWVTAADLPRLRSWASPGNPAWAEGLAVEVERVRDRVDHGQANDDGSAGWVEDPVEADAELLAFASLVEPSPADRAADAERARRLLMTGIAAAGAGPRDGRPYRSPAFSIDDRSRWWGEGWGLTVDWIYPSLSASDKAAIRRVFLRWSAEDERGGQTTSDHPEPPGAHDDAALLADPVALRWSANNYFTAHARNLVLMALALDPADDPGGELHQQVASATGGFLAMADSLLRGDGRGGAPAEGFEYGPQSLGYLAEAVLALETAGRSASLAGNPFWDEVGPWLLHALSPAPVAGDGGQPVWLPASYGDAQHYGNPDWISLFGALGVLDQRTGAHPDRLAMARWIEINTPDGGAAGLSDRISDPQTPLDSILYFLLLDPHAPTPPDPRPKLPLASFAAGLGRLSVRTGWDPGATWLTFAAGWDQIDHQQGDALDVGLFRNGEWLTKARSGYDLSTSDQKNTLAIENDRPEHADDGDYRQLEWQTGSQFTYVASGPGHVTSSSTGAGYVYAAGDATDLYNSAREGSTDVLQATRDVIWLEPDVVVVYDRATTRTAGRFKRFFLQLPSQPVITGTRAATTTRSGQHLVVDNLLPAGAVPRAEPLVPDADGQLPGTGDAQVAAGEPMDYRLRIDAPGDPADVRFLDVLNASAAGSNAAQPSLVRSLGGTPFDGAVVGSVLVLFPKNRGFDTDVRVSVPAGVHRVLVTGLRPSAGYGVRLEGGVLTVVPDGSLPTDGAGVLDATV